MKGEKDVTKLFVKKLKMKGLHMPQIFLWSMGMVQNGRGLIVETENGYDSPYINKKRKDYHAYMAKAYQYALRLLSQSMIIREQALHEWRLAGERMEKLERNPQDLNLDDGGMTVAERRRILAGEKEKRRLEEIRTENLKKIKVIDAAVSELETELEEMLLETRYKLEGMLFTYLAGAHIVAKRQDLDISTADGALQIYRACVPERGDGHKAAEM